MYPAIHRDHVYVLPQMYVHLQEPVLLTSQEFKLIHWRVVINKSCCFDVSRGDSFETSHDSEIIGDVSPAYSIFIGDVRLSVSFRVGRSRCDRELIV